MVVFVGESLVDFSDFADVLTVIRHNCM
jgi:hypothetical protein